MTTWKPSPAMARASGWCIRRGISWPWTSTTQRSPGAVLGVLETVRRRRRTGRCAPTRVWPPDFLPLGCPPRITTPDGMVGWGHAWFSSHADARRRHGGVRHRQDDGRRGAGRGARLRVHRGRRAAPQAQHREDDRRDPADRRGPLAVAAGDRRAGRGQGPRGHLDRGHLLGAQAQLPRRARATRRRRSSCTCTRRSTCCSSGCSSAPSTSCRPALLRSQFDTLEELGDDEPGAVIDVTPPIDEVVEEAVNAVRVHYTE